ncbi:MAG: c-type cytochrome biogenesis protein CcsB [Chloroflexi bacterium]|nr:c-type cytochrome biogenesis protein CcsB [Chloroflexota bacterium]MCI0783719.1 c-type cytochrome biogenesis protein CcsB [Chloroflexota bacterium]MCI0814587.1 c-type cytochrome biogenesis protein CcsB [Chloroflexota bacterium]MCI0816981.1 c-type cytochrome biogenesis protein CcsB [Chloroflexota bacterium]MCI0819615.1 c-type cytochrome biogenesis protein CcsB [Chloroflexota bacterium]
MESLASTTLYLAIAACAVATMAYWAHTLGLGLVVRRLATPIGAGPAVASIERSDANGWAQVSGRFATFATWTALALLSVSLLARWQAVDHAPWSNMYEFTIAFATAILAFYAIFEQVYVARQGTGDRSRGLRSPRALGSVALPVVLTGLVVAALYFPSDVRPLVPALQNTDLLAIHVAAMILAYAALSVSFASGVLYLVQGAKNRFQRLPKSKLLDEIGYKSVALGFPLLAGGIALGAYWANSAWGRYWGWDPKESAALVTLLIYGVYLHMRGLRKWSGTRSSVVLVVGFGAVLFTYFVVNLWISGLHSYAGV